MLEYARGGEVARHSAETIARTNLQRDFHAGIMRLLPPVPGGSSATDTAEQQHRGCQRQGFHVE